MLIPEPRINESENDFIIRAHQLLASAYPETDKRNAAIFGAWRKSRGESDLEMKAYEKFGEDQFATSRDVPIFTEHAYIDRHGNEQRYDLSALKAVCDRCNYRIEDTGNFATISEGHTPTRDQVEAGAKSPSILGFAGPFRLGMIGNREPRWAIFSDEHYYRSDIDKIRKLPTRSPEVWVKKEMRDRFMDPIAALGSETPRLDMGVRFSRAESGDVVEKYSGAAVGNFKRLTPEDFKVLIDALEQTDIMCWIKTKMIAEKDLESKMHADNGPQRYRAAVDKPRHIRNVVPSYILPDIPGALLAQEVMDLVENSRAANDPVSYDDALQAVRETRFNGATPHKHHRLSKPAEIEFYRLERANRLMEQRVSAVEQTSAAGNAERVMDYVQVQRARGRYINYEQGRRELGIR